MEAEKISIVHLFEGEPIKVTRSEADRVREALKTGEGFLEFAGVTINIKGIARIEDTSELMQNGYPQIKAPVDTSDGQPYIAEDNSVKVAFVKKTISEREYHRSYGGPGYIVLDRIGTDVVIGFSYVPVRGHDLPSHLDYCTPSEQETLAFRSGGVR